MSDQRPLGLVLRDEVQCRFRLKEVNGGSRATGLVYSLRILHR